MDISIGMSIFTVRLAPVIETTKLKMQSLLHLPSSLRALFLSFGMNIP